MSSLPDYYLSIRLRSAHSKLDLVKSKIVFDVPTYCIYTHNTSYEHFHICVPGHTAKDVNRFAKRVKDNFGVTGNGGYSCKTYDNGCRSFMFYCGHEGLAPVYADEAWTPLFESIDQYFVKHPEKVGQSMLPLEKSKKKDAEADWQLTYSNFVSKSINHARQYALTGGLKETLQHLCETTKWRPSYHMVKNGVPDHYYRDYEFRSGKRQKFDMDWMTPKSF